MKKHQHGRPLRFSGLWLLSIFLVLQSVAHAQIITGTVSDEKGTKLLNVSVVAKGTSQGTATDADGKYRIPAGSDATLVFSSVGYKTLEVPIAGRSVVNVSLAASNEDLGEVVVTALA